MPIHLAVRRGHVNAVRALLEAGASPFERDPQERTAWDLARLDNRAEIIRTLMEFGDPDVENLNIRDFWKHFTFRGHRLGTSTIVLSPQEQTS